MEATNYSISVGRTENFVLRKFRFYEFDFRKFQELLIKQLLFGSVEQQGYVRNTNVSGQKLYF